MAALTPESGEKSFNITLGQNLEISLQELEKLAQKGGTLRDRAVIWIKSAFLTLTTGHRINEKTIRAMLGNLSEGELLKIQNAGFAALSKLARVALADKRTLANLNQNLGELSEEALIQRIKNSLEWTKPDSEEASPALKKLFLHYQRKFGLEDLSESDRNRINFHVRRDIADQIIKCSPKDNSRGILWAKYFYPKLIEGMKQPSDLKKLMEKPLGLEQEIEPSEVDTLWSVKVDPLNMKETSTTLNPILVGHLRFDLDTEEFPGFENIEGTSHSLTFKLLRFNDWEPGCAMLQQAETSPKKSGVSDETWERIAYISRTFSRSANFFASYDAGIPSPKFVHDSLRDLGNNEALIIPGGTTDHGILFELKKTNGKIYLKVYNSGAGCEDDKTNSDRFIVPCYEIENIDKATATLTELLQFRSQSYDDIAKKKPLWEIVEKKVTDKEHGGKRLPSPSETHEKQKRGNCAWKSISTWFRQQTKVPITITDEIINAVPEDQLELKKTLEQLRGQTILLNQFFKKIGYENNRFKVKQLFDAHAGVPPNPDAEKMRTVYVSLKGKVSTQTHQTENVKRYFSRLVKNICEESAFVRNERKARNREKKMSAAKAVNSLGAPLRKGIAAA